MQSISAFTFSDLYENPFEFYDAMHREQPVSYSPELGMYIVSKYNDCKR